jgi:hypothetical protein
VRIGLSSPDEQPVRLSSMEVTKMNKERIQEILMGSTITQEEKIAFLEYGESGVELGEYELELLKKLASDHVTASKGATVINSTIKEVSKMTRSQFIMAVVSNVRSMVTELDTVSLIRIINEMVSTDTDVSTLDPDVITSEVMVSYSLQDDSILDKIAGEIVDSMFNPKKEQKGEKESKKPIEWKKLGAKAIAGSAHGLKKASVIVAKKYIPDAKDAVIAAGKAVRTEYVAMKDTETVRLAEKMEAAGYSLNIDEKGHKSIVRHDGNSLTNEDARILRGLKYSR